MRSKVKKPHKSTNKIQDNENEVQELSKKYESMSVANEIKKFLDMPLSQKTLKGLLECEYIELTDIQRNGILPALLGKDVIATAITGSGKTLAFLIPVIEHLYVNKWSRSDGVCAIVISPTRELAYQIFETLKRIGRYHDFSAGLIIGGKNLNFERRRMDQCNILICTPGRLLQHMDENPLFNTSTIEMLVLDEADRCLDMGFEEALNAIIENFPTEVQTLLFSATQTNSVKDIARLSLRDPVVIDSKKTMSEEVIPVLLQQNYVVIELEDKITMLWSFIKNHLKQKIIVFFSSCKQVKYVFEIFCKLRPGTSLLALYGSLHQDRRIAIYKDFMRKSNVVLFATDIASRGLDFPTVNWVVQMDCPEDAIQYIHRAGRTARNKARGESLLVLTSFEESSMMKELQSRNIQIQKIHIDPKKLFSPRLKIEAALAQNLELKASAQRAFISYIKSIFLMRNKNIFNVFNINFDSYAKSLGLVATPRVRFLERLLKENLASSNNLARSNDFNQEDSDNDDFLTVKRIDHGLANSSVEIPIDPPKKKVISKAALAKKSIRKQIQINEKINFDDDGNIVIDKRKELQSELSPVSEDSAGGINIEVAKQILSQEDSFDKKRFRELVKHRHKKQKDKLKKNADENLRSDVESDSGDHVDLSWLPDPDKIYNSANQSDNGIRDDVKEPSSKRVKLTSKLTLNDAESIAEQLLSNKL